MSNTTYPLDPYTSVAILRSAFDAQESISTGRVKALVDLDEINLEIPFGIEFGTTTTQETAAGGAALHTFDILIAPWQVGRTLNVVVDGAMDANGGDFWVRLAEPPQTNGTEVAIDNTGAVVSKGPSVLVIPTITGGAESPFHPFNHSTFEIRGRVDSGADTLTLESLQRVTCWFGPPP